VSRSIICPTDFSAASGTALSLAAALARQSGARLLVAHVELPSPPPLGRAETGEVQRAGEEASLIESLNRLAAEREPAVSYEIRQLRGDPTVEIVRLARDERAELIVMATSGRTGWRRLLMGSVAEAVIRDAACPVLTLKQPAVPAEQTQADFSAAEAEIEFREDPAAEIAAVRQSALALLERAVQARATDVHIDPLGDGREVRFRIDGRLEHYCRLPREVGQPLTSQLKIMAELDIANPFQSQEGRFSLPQPLEHEVRLTRVPVVGGESIALRLLSGDRLLRPLDSLGLGGGSLDRLHQMLRHGEGVVLVTGPANSGKTTTAYSMAHAMDDGHRNLVTMEDPVEYRVPGFRQMSVDPRHGITMTSGLRSLLRMDPDVVLVGEIRDAETAETAMRAASSGKYVFTTIHTRDVASTVTALRDLKIDNRSLAGNLTGIISQRLVRRLCEHCRRLTPTTESQAQVFRDAELEPPATLPASGGCARCRQTGYFERVGVFEVVVPDRAIRDAIEQGASEDELRDLLRSRGTQSLMADALAKVRDGITSLDEALGMSWVSFAG
jgi:type II secretory ATPase GspE/PulE/Tfp pilus assembly ATPase PilB-like protein